MKRFKSSVDIDGALTVGGQPVVGGGGAGAIASSIVDAKGDLIVGTAADTVNRLAAGTDGQVLSVDSAEATGLKWVDANFTGGGGGADVYCAIKAHQANFYTAPILFSAVVWNAAGLITETHPNMWDVAQPTRITIPLTGTYTVIGQINIEDFPLNKELISVIRVNGVDANPPAWSRGPGGEGQTYSIERQVASVLQLTAGDYVELYCYNGTGASVGLDARTSLIVAQTGIASGESSSQISPNLLHNPAFEIWQRGTASVSCAAGNRTFLADRWFVRPAGAAVTQQQITSVPAGSYARYALQIDGAASVTTVDVAQRVEAANIPALARTVTFSWRVYNGTGASVTPSLLIGTPAASDDFTTVTNRLTQSLQACADAAWTTVSHTVDVSSYTDLANGMEIGLQFPSGSVVAGDTVRITEAQVTATNGMVGFSRPGTGVELTDCQRYYWRWQSVDGNEVIGLPGVSTSTNHTYFFGIQLPVPMRVVPLISSSGLVAFRTGWGYYPLNDRAPSSGGWSSNVTLAPSLTRVSGTWGSEYPVFLAIQAPVAGKYLDADAEL